MNKINVSRITSEIRSLMVRRSPEILTGVGIAGMITMTVMAVRATPKALTLIEERKAEKKEDKLTTMETVQVTWKCYIPSVVTGCISVGCLIGANSVNVRRHAALATAYSLSESALKEYQSKVVETIGEKKEQSVRDSIAKDRIDKNPPVNREIIITEKGNTLCYDSLSGRYFRSDIDKIRKTENELNRRMRNEMYISLNDFYHALELDPIGVGNDIGWNIDSGNIEISFSSQLSAEDTPCLVLDYHVRPKEGFNRVY